MIDWRAPAEMAAIWTKKPEPKLREKACEAFDHIRFRMEEIARQENRQPPRAEAEEQPGIYAFWQGEQWTTEQLTQPSAAALRWYREQADRMEREFVDKLTPLGRQAYEAAIREREA